MRKIWKKALTKICAAVMVFACVGVGANVAEAKTAFSDVKEGAWYEASVQYVYDNGLMSGSNGLFNPTSDITRAQIVTTLYRLAGEPEVTDWKALADFTDVGSGKYYTNSVCWAYAKGIATGNNGQFSPTGKLTRQQMAAFFFRYAEVMGLDTVTRGNISAMLNADKVSGYATDAVEWAVGVGLISGSNVTVNGTTLKDLNPRGNTTRAQVATILKRFCEDVAVKGEECEHREVIDPAVEPTETQTGWTEGSHCDICGKVLIAQVEIPKLDGTYHSITYRNLSQYGAETPEINRYSEKEGLDELPVPEAPGYKFVGWYTQSQGGEVVDYISAGSTKNYVLFARWELETYNIYYYEAPEHSNAETYTVEDRILLSEPKWSGLKFMGWYDEAGKLYTEIPKGTTGDLELTATWKLMRNIATPGNNTLMLAEYDAEREQFMFIYELGTLEHVVLEELSSSTPNLYNHTGAGDFTLSLEKSLTMEESVADSITRTISKSISSSSEWETSKEWAKENSKEHNVNVSIGMEIGSDFAKATIEAGYGYTTGSSSSWGESATEGGSYGEEIENGEEVSSSLSYLESLSTTTSTSITISADSPEGYYSYVHAGNIRVFGVVVYDPNTGNIHLNTYSRLDNMHDMVLYYPDVNSLNHPTCETLEYKVPREEIFDAISKAYFVEYKANGGKGQMNKTLHTIGGEEKLLENSFKREGYTFMGWEERNVDGTAKSTYTDGQIVRNLSSKGSTVTLHALWEANSYTINYEGNKPAMGSTYVDKLPKAANCSYDADVTLAAAPTLAGYTFGGWYADSTCSEKVGDAGQKITKANFTSEVNGSISLYAKWTANNYTLTYDLDGGTASAASKQITFDKLYGDIPTPTKADHVFLGWQMEDGTMLTGTEYVRAVGDHTITAKWLKTKAVIYLRDDVLQPDEPDIRIDDDDEFYHDKIDPQMNKQELLKNGYTKVVIDYEFQLCEIDQGNQHMRLEAWDDYTKPFYEEKYNSTPSGWTSYNGTVEVDLDSDFLSDTLHFFAGFDAYGNGEDDWWLGDTRFTITVKK